MKADNSGTLICEASDAAGHRSAKYSLRVMQPPGGIFNNMVILQLPSGVMQTFTFAYLLRSENVKLNIRYDNAAVKRACE